MNDTEKCQNHIAKLLESQPLMYTLLSEKCKQLNNYDVIESKSNYDVIKSKSNDLGRCVKKMEAIRKKIEKLEATLRHIISDVDTTIDELNKI